VVLAKADHTVYDVWYNCRAKPNIYNRTMMSSHVSCLFTSLGPRSTSCWWFIFLLCCG